MRSAGVALSIACRRRALRARPRIAVAHAVGAIEQHDDVARAAGRGRELRAAQERPRKRGDDQRDRRQPQRQQQPVANAAPLHRLVRNLAQEHQRRKLDRPTCAPSASGESAPAPPARPRPEQEQRRQERHGLPRPRQPLPHRQEPEQREVERHAGVEQHVIHRLLRRLLASACRCAPAPARDSRRRAWSARSASDRRSPCPRSSTARRTRSRSPADPSRETAPRRCRGARSGRPRGRFPPARRRNRRSRR